MSSQANVSPQTEPTMEEILASIRKIISEDQPAEGPKPVARSAPPKPQPVPEIARVATPAASSGDLDVLDLTEEVQDDTVSAVAHVPAAAPPADDVIFQTIEPVSRIKERLMDDDLVSDNARHAMGRAFANLNGHTPQVALKGGSVEALFSDAVQNAFRAALKEWVDEHSNEVMDQLRPLIRAWMDEHLPPLVEAAVIKEIGRAASRKL